MNSQNEKEVLIEYGTNENLKQVEFNCEKKTEFYIGRKADADIQLSESKVSREQAMIYYENGKWYIKDGGKEKPSGSGTWLFLEKKYEIKSDIIFMIGSSSIKLDYILPGTNEVKIEGKNEEKNEAKEDGHFLNLVGQKINNEINDKEITEKKLEDQTENKNEKINETNQK